MKRTISLMIIVAMLATTACGKEEVSMSADDLELRDAIQEELTQEDIDFINEVKSEMEEDYVAEDSSAEASSAETVYTLDFEPTDEILNAKFDEGKVQVGKDMIFQLFTMTFADVDKIISESGESERYKWDKYDQYVPDEEKICLRIDGEAYLEFVFKNFADQGNIRTKIEDCRLIEINRYFNTPDKKVYYAGGICSDGRNINLDNIESLFVGYEEGYEDDKQTGKWYFSNSFKYGLSIMSQYGAKSFVKGYTPYFYEYQFAMDKSDGKCKGIGLSSHLNSYWNYKDLGLNQDDYILLDLLQNDSASQNDSSTTDEHSDSAWGDIEVKEYVDDEYGIHFYLPASAKITVKEPWYNFDIVNRTYYISGDGFNGEEYLCQTQKAPEGMGGDSIEDELFGEIAKKDGYVYSINFLNPDTQYDFELSDAMIKFISDYRQKILDSAWVE